MNPGHIHLLLNHIPTIGFGIGLGLFVVALVLKQVDLQRVCLVIFFLTAAVTIATYISGNDAREAMKEMSEISDPLMQAHESAALLAFVFMEITGFLSWLALWIWDRPSQFARRNLNLTLVFGIITFALMSRAAYVGGAIRHPETDAVQAASIDASVQTFPRVWGVFVQDHSWVWPTAETLHFVGLCLLFGVVLIVNLRLIGVGRNLLSLEALRQLLPLGMLGFCLNLITGMMFFVATPEQYTGFLFFLKMVLIITGALDLLVFMLMGKEAKAWLKFASAFAILVWLGVLFCGHMLPWLGNSF